MPIQCAQCGHENQPQYRFCGMCGVTLQPAPPVTREPARESAPPTISGPSFLGLGEDRTRSLDYLLEDDEPRPTHGRMYLALILLIVSAGLLVWHWRRDGYPWATATASVPTATTLAAESPTNSSSITPSTTSPVDSHTTAPEDSHAPAVPAETEAAPQQPTPEAAAPNTAAAPQTNDADSLPQPSDDAESAAPTPKAGEMTVAETQAASMEKPTAPVARIAKPSAAPAESAAASATFEDKLVAEGEKYLYGTGVPQDCDRAQKNLRTAAQRSNPKAQSILGTMYATGHCVSRDLPTAYRWFAKALHQEPGNARVQRDLEVLWRQMTAPERQAATRAE